MKYCSNCGAHLADNVNFCSNCGASQIARQSQQPQQSQQTYYSQQPNYNTQNYYSAQPSSSVNSPKDEKSFGIALLGFFVPIVGLILFLVWKDSSPLKAKSAGKGALTGFIIATVSFVLLIILLFAMASLSLESAPSFFDEFDIAEYAMITLK